VGFTVSSQHSHRRESAATALLLRFLLVMGLTLLSVPLLSTPSSADDGTDPMPVVETSEDPAGDPASDAEVDPAEEVIGDPEGEPATDPAPLAVAPADSAVDDPATEPVRDGADPDTLGQAESLADAVTQRAAKLLAPAAKPEDPPVDPCDPYVGELIGNFEIDGDLAPCAGHVDWATPGVPLPDDDEFDDSTNFGEGSAEMQNPTAWTEKADVAPPKDDIGLVYLHDDVATVQVPDGDDPSQTHPEDHTFSLFGFTRRTATGTASYDVEYNQHPNSDDQFPQPTRTPGDLLIQVEQGGNGGFELTGAFMWTVDEGPYSNKPGAGECWLVEGYDPESGWCPISDAAANFTGAISADKLFAEGALDLTALLDNETCQPDFGMVNIRSRSSNEVESALKDWVLPMPVRIEGTCKDMYIEKIDAATGHHIVGATFEISPDPRPGVAPPSSAVVTDNVDSAMIEASQGGYPANQIGDEDPNAGYIKISEIEPRTYTVTEIEPPTGYAMAPDPSGACPAVNELPATVNCATQTISDSDGTWVFEDKKLWDAPSITKTAHGSYDSGYTWQIRKTVAPNGEDPAEDDVATKDVDESGQAEQAVAEGGSATFDYEVTLTGAETKGNYRVTGHVNVVNPNSDPMTVTLTDAIENGDNDITCAFDDDTGGASFSPLVPPTDVEAEPAVGTAYAYTCALTPEQAASEELGDNQAWIEWNLDDYPQTEEQAWQENSEAGVPSSGNPATATFDFAPPPANETGKTVVVSDTYGEFGGPHTVTFGEDEVNFVGDRYVVSWPYSVTFGDPPAGICTDYDNTAEVRAQLAPGTALTAEQGELFDSDSATATVCVGSDLTVSKVTTTSLTREYPFTIEKTTPKSRVDVTGDGTATVQYDVVVTDGPAKDSDWKMTSTVTVSNPNTWQDITLTSWADVYRTTVNGQQVDLKPACTPRDAAPYVVPEATVDGGVKTDGMLTIVLDCTFATKPPYDGTNRATVSWDAKAATTPSGSAVGTDPVVEADWTLDAEIHKTVDVIDVLTEAGVPVDATDLDLGTVTWQSAGHEHTAEEAGGDGPHAEFSYTRELEGTPGECVTYDNRASVMTQGNEPSVIDSDTATVKVCWQDDLSVSKTGSGMFWRRYDWSVEKSILVGPEGEQTEVDAQTVKLDDPTLTHSFEYRVKAIPLPLAADADSGWYVEGTITVTNPNSSDVADSTEVTIIEQPDMGDGADCDVTDGVYTTEGDVDVDVTDGVVNLPAEDSVTVDYTCTFSSAPHGTQQDLYDGNYNQATITWDGGEDTTAKTPVEFTLPDEQRTDWTVEVHDDQLDPTLLGTVAWDDDAEHRTFEYSLDHTGTAGECEAFPNTATVEHITTTSFLVAEATEALASDSTTATVCVQKRLTLDSTVTTSFDRTYKWVIDKVADKHDAEVSGNSTSPFEYTVSVGPDTSVNGGKGYVDSGWAMTGTITVTNPNTEEIGSIEADLSDVTSVGGGATCLVEGTPVHAVTVPVGATGVTVDYVCSFASQPAYSGTNTATAAWTLASGGDTHADSVASVGFENPADTTRSSPRETDRVIDVTDAFDGGAGVPVVGLQDLDWLEVKALPGSVKVVKYTRNLGAPPGGCRTYPNVVTMFRDGTSTQLGLPAVESVSVCSQVGPTLVNGATASYDRTYAWDIAKEADGTEFSTGNGGTAAVDYTVTATPGAATDSGWTMTGSVQVSNPNTYKSLTVGLSPTTTVGGGAACSLAPGQDMVVPASGSRAYSYSCTFTSQPSYVGTVSAAVSWGGGTASADAPVAFALDQETDKVVDVVDDQTDPAQSVGLGTATWNAEGTPTVFTYSLDLAAEANDCEDYTNTAAIVQTAQSADATVTVCGPEILPEEEAVTPPAKPRPPTVKGVEAVIPSTGGPQLGLLWLGAGLAVVGGLLMTVRRRARSQS
jgi:hypothetical protein